jgi:hypothetical protein
MIYFSNMEITSAVILPLILFHKVVDNELEIAPELHMGGFRDGGWQFLTFGRCH